jgi:malate dehydrogenase (oxaloacetate-decarboxylating)(NADP+)
LLIYESAAVAKAAMETGVARVQIDLDEYRDRLERHLGRSREFMRGVINCAKSQPKRIVFPEGNEERVLRAIQILRQEEICEPVLIGTDKEIRAQAQALGIELDGVSIVDPRSSEKLVYYRKELVSLRKRKGVTDRDAERLLGRRGYFGVMMVRMGDAHGLVAGLSKSYSESIRPSLEVVGLAEGRTCAAGVYVVIQKDRVVFVADGSVNIDPSAEQLAEIAAQREMAAGSASIRRSGALDLELRSVRSAHTDQLGRAPDARALAEDPRRDARRHRARPGAARVPLRLRRDQGRGERADLPEPGLGAHQHAPARHDRRRHRGRPDPDGHAQPGELAPADRDRRRHRQPDRDHGAAGAEGVLTCRAPRRAPRPSRRC